MPADSGLREPNLTVILINTAKQTFFFDCCNILDCPHAGCQKLLYASPYAGHQPAKAQPSKINCKKDDDPRQSNAEIISPWLRNLHM